MPQQNSGREGVTAHPPTATESGHEQSGHGLDREILVLGAVIVIGTIMAILDATIVNVAIPTLGSDFHTSISAIQWVMTGYLLAFASVIPLTAWASERFGAKRVWLASLLLFMVGSALAGAAWSIDSLILFRVLQGFGGGMILPVGQTILAQAAGPQRIGRVMSVVGVPMLLAPISGPVIGGAIVDQVSWRWIFFVNLPVSLVALLLAWRLLPDVEPRRGRRLDLRGLALLPPGIAIFVYGMSEAATAGALGGGRALAGMALGLVLVALFVWHAWRRGHAALLDVSLFARRGFAAAAGANLLIGIALFGALILLPLYFQTVRGESPLATGLLLAPQGLGAAFAMPIAGRLTDEIGARLVIPAGLLLAIGGTAAYTQVGADSSYVFLAGALFVIGLGLGSTIMPSMAVAYQAVAREDVPQATSAINVIQRIAGSVGTALLAVVLQRQIASNLPGLDGGLGALAGLAQEERSQAAPALADAFGSTFWVALAVVAAALLPALLLPRLRPQHAAAASAPERASPKHEQRRKRMPTKHAPIDVRLRGEQTKGRLAAIENTIGAGFGGPPLHVHPDFDETFYVLEGELTFQLESERLTAGAGVLVFAPGETPHAFANLSGKQARVLILCTPAGFERYFDRLAAQQAGVDPPPEASGPIPETRIVGPQIARDEV
jgi:EmrB/QacA subfamily drug resistance transporter